MSNPKNATPHLLCFGMGYTAQTLSHRVHRMQWTISGTTRSGEKRKQLSQRGWNIFPFDTGLPLDLKNPVLKNVSHVLLSIPPKPDDPVLTNHSSDLAGRADLRWVGYLSSVGVYGNHDGQLVDETSELKPVADRTRHRMRAEAQWLDWGQRTGIPVHVFRLPGIYGPGKGLLEKVRKGNVQRIDLPGHRFSHIHVEDLATTLIASINNPRSGAIYNVSDDTPYPQSDSVEYACKLLGMTAPDPVPLAEAGFSEMARSFYTDFRRISNAKMKNELGVRLKFPDFHEGLRSIVEESGS